jgi:hypothetical protein
MSTVSLLALRLSFSESVSDTVSLSFN